MDDLGLSWAPPAGQAPPQDRSVYPRFYVEGMPDPETSKVEGRPMFRDVELVEIRIAGDKNNIRVTKVTDQHRQRWPREYAMFRQGVEQSPEGTPLEQWPPLSKSQVLEYKAAGILTVEHIAALPDTALQRLGMGARQLQAQAKAYLESAKGNAPIQALAARNAVLEEQVAAQATQIKQLGDAIESLRAERRAA